ncbi:MAG: multicopper oxidase domain-containing protein [Candidatus Pacebacteria bacterium]|jgi:FtsP/CotA-like multicopper oxidase with cupredoxin domain|nr:multicopper oxidase domain-containing protein [Candidatus Paceibacterota bacterium]|tara:strand:- start:12718 stop:14055 length:1338 start_codon:yes stop_codon:yes gene_type:complete
MNKDLQKKLLPILIIIIIVVGGVLFLKNKTNDSIADLNIPPGLDGAFVQEDGSVKTTAGDNAGGARVMPDGTVVLGSGETIPGAHVMPDGTVMLVQKMEDSVLPTKRHTDRVGDLPYVFKDGAKEFHITIDDIMWEYADGKSVHAWGYNGQIPGPTIRVDEGDKVRVVVMNHLTYDKGTTIHWHGVRMPENSSDGVPGLDQYPILPGETFVYEFTAVNAGTHFYHTHGSSHVDIALQDDMGLHGPLIIEPKNRFDERHTSNYDREYIFMLDEWAVGDEGMNHAIHLVGDDGSHVHQEANVFTINGRIFPDNLEEGTLWVKEGDKVIVRLVNNGSEAVHPMHTHGHSFKVIAIDGELVPRSAQQSMDTITLHPGERRDLVIEANNPGVWLFHCHNVHHASVGMIMAFFYEGHEPCCLEEKGPEEIIQMIDTDDEYAPDTPDDHEHN